MEGWIVAKHVGMTPRVSGAMTALVTPFRDGQIDGEALDGLVERQIDGGIDWLVPCGTTGESPTLTDAEHQRVLEAVLTKTAGSCRVMAGTGTNCTAETVRRTRHAKKAGANAALVVAPYYNRPSPEGLYRHFAETAGSCDLPIVLYNVPARTGVQIGNDDVVRLREAFPNIVAIKHATGSVDGVTELLSRCDIAVLSGDDPLTWPLMAMGAVGVVSVISNLLPALVKSLVSAALQGNSAAALRLHRRVHEVAVELGRYGPNPVPIKTALAIAGLIREEFRLPLCPVDAEARAAIERAVRQQEIAELTPI